MADPPPPPIDDSEEDISTVTRLKNICLNNFRGILGFSIGFAFLPAFEPGYSQYTVRNTWLLMFWYFFMQPVKVPATALIPIFMFPITGIMSSDDVAQCYFNDIIALFITAGMLNLVMNNSGFDRRMVLSFLCSGGACDFSGKALITKASSVSFIMSMFSNRLIVTKTIIETMTPIIDEMESSTAEYRSTEMDFDTFRHVFNNAVQTSSAIGSIVILHASFATLAFKAIWSESAKPLEYEDMFNYFQYTVFALPVALVMFFLSLCYHKILLGWVSTHDCTVTTMSTIREALMTIKKKQKPMTSHETLSVFFTMLLIITLVTRWCPWLSYGWATFRAEPTQPTVPGVKDATVAALFCLILNCLPKDFYFLKYLSASKESELPPCKPCSPILWWRYVDLNTNYSYIFVIGSGVALNAAVRATGLDKTIAETVSPSLTDVGWNATIFLVVLTTAVLANVMSGVAACVSVMPFVLSLRAIPEANLPWPTHAYLGALGVGIASSFGFMQPFRYTPAHYAHQVGKSTRMKMAWYAVGSVIICSVILWLALILYAPMVFDPSEAGFKAMQVGKSEAKITTDAATDAIPASEDSTDSTNPTDPTNPTNPTDPTDPTDSTGSTDLTDSTEPNN